MSDPTPNPAPEQGAPVRDKPSFEAAAPPPALDPSEVRPVSESPGDRGQGDPSAASSALPNTGHVESADGGATEGAETSSMSVEEDLRRQAQEITAAALEAVASSAAAQKIDAMSRLVLDAADLANRSAAASTAAGQKLLETRTELEAELAKARRHSKIVLGVTAGVAVVSLVLTAAIIAQVGSRLSRLDATVLAVGKRFVEVGTGLETLTVLTDSLAELQVRQDAFAQSQTKLQAQLEEANKASQGLVTQVPQATAKEVQARTQAMMQQVQSIDARVQAQAAAVKRMADEVKALQGQGEGLVALRREVEALVVLQKERYLEAARAAGAVGSTGRAAVPVAPVPRGVQYPRPQPPAPEAVGTGTSVPPPTGR